MVTKYSRLEISIINNLQKDSPTRVRLTQKDRNIAIPDEENLDYIFDMAKSGNEMAAVQIDEWIRFCRPHNLEEKSRLGLIRKVANEIFE